MQITRLILFLLFVLLSSVSLSAFDGDLNTSVPLSMSEADLNTIDNDANLILEGRSEPLQIIKVKIYNTKYVDDEYYAFIMSDEEGKYQLTTADMNISRIKDGVLSFEVSTNEEESSKEIENFSFILDKGLTLKLATKNPSEYEGDGYVNRDEVNNYMVYGETETNIKDFNLVISDINLNSISFTLADLIIDEDGVFKIENIDLSSLKDGKLNVVANGVDIAGNIAKFELSIIKDTLVVKPVLVKKIKNNNLSNVVNRKILVASGTSEPNAKIFFTFYQGEVEVIESVVANDNGEWELLGGDLDVSVFKNADVNVEIYQVDVALNKGEALEYVNNKFKRPIFPLSPIAIDPQKYQLIYTITGHTDEIKDMFITKKDIFVATYGYIKVWGKAYAKLKREVEIRDIWVNTLVVHDSKVFAGLGNGNINVYSEKNLKLLKTIKADALSVLNLKVSGDKLISSSSSGLIKVWDTSSYKNLGVIKNHQWDVASVAINDGKLYSGSDDYSIKIFDLNSMKLLKTIKSAHSGTINDLLVYEGMLISASDDKTVVIRDALSGELIRVLEAHKKGVNKLKVTNDFLISISSDRSMIFWDMQTGERYKKIKAHSKLIGALDVNDFNIVTGSRDYKIKIWGYDDSVEALDDEDETKKPKYALIKSIKLKKGIPTSLSQNENDIVISTNNGYIYFYNKITHDYVRRYTTLDKIVKPKLSKNKDAELSDEEDSEENVERDFVPKMQKVYDCANYGNQLLCGLDDSTVKVWDQEKNQAISLLVGNELAITDIKISPTNILTASKKGTVGVFDIETGKFVNLIEGHQHNVDTIALFEDDKVVSAGEDYSIKIREVETGDLILNIKNAHEDIITKILVFENYLISASLDGTIKVRNILSGKLIKILDAHKSGVTSMVLDEDNLISTSKDKTLIAWSMKDFSNISVMDKHKKAVIDVMITDDYIVSTSEDKTIKVWKYYE